MTTPNEHGYTLVQHSGVTTGHAEFTHGLESRRIATQAERQLIERAGGVVFDTYQQAEAYAEAEQYPPGHDGLIPAAPGHFSKYGFDDSPPFYIPVPAPTEQTASFSLTITYGDREKNLHEAMRRAVDWLAIDINARARGEHRLGIDVFDADGEVVAGDLYDPEENPS